VARKLVKQRQSMPSPPTHATTGISPSLQRTDVSKQKNDVASLLTPNGSRRDDRRSAGVDDGACARPISVVPSSRAPLKKHGQPSLKARKDR
jgi:hypothetical protein